MKGEISPGLVSVCFLCVEGGWYSEQSLPHRLSEKCFVADLMGVKWKFSEIILFLYFLKNSDKEGIVSKHNISGVEIYMKCLYIFVT